MLYTEINIELVTLNGIQRTLFLGNVDFVGFFDLVNHAECCFLLVKDTNVVVKAGSGDGGLHFVSLPVGDSVVELVEECPCCPAFG